MKVNPVVTIKANQPTEEPLDAKTQKLVDEIQAMSQHPDWIKFLNKDNSQFGTKGRGRVKKT